MPKKKKTEQTPKATPAPETKKESAAPKKHEKKPVIVTETPEPPFSDFADPGFKVPKGEILSVTIFNKKHIPVYAITYKPYTQDYFLYKVDGSDLTKMDKAKSPIDFDKKIKYK